MGKRHQRMDRNGIWRFSEDDGRQEKVAMYFCNVICGAPTTVNTKGLRWNEDCISLTLCKAAITQQQSKENMMFICARHLHNHLTK